MKVATPRGCPGRQAPGIGKGRHMAGSANLTSAGLGSQAHVSRTGTDRRSLLLFHLPGHACALPLASVQEVVPMPLLSRPPGLPSVLAGFLDLGGAIVPVLRLDRLLGLSEVVPGLYTPLLVLRQPEDRLALL